MDEMMKSSVIWIFVLKFTDAVYALLFRIVAAPAKIPITRVQTAAHLSARINRKKCLLKTIKQRSV